MSADLKGMTAVVTGAGQGVGRGIALALAREGAFVVLGGRTLGKVQSVSNEIQELGGDALAVECDVANRAAVDAMIDAAVERSNRIDVLVNNAQASPPYEPLHRVGVESLEMAWQSGPIGTLNCMQSALRFMRDEGGSIVNVGSRVGIDGDATSAAYSMAKEAIRALTRVAAREWGRHRIRVNVICPFADSPSLAALRDGMPERQWDSIVGRTSLGYMGDAELDIGAAVVALTSPGMRYLTGATLMLDGGWCILH